MDHERPGPLRRLGMRAFRLAPARLVWPAIRVASPTYTVGAIALIEYDGKLLALRQTHRRGVSLPGGLVEGGVEKLAVAGEGAAAAGTAEGGIHDDAGLGLPASASGIALLGGPASIANSGTITTAGGLDGTAIGALGGEALHTLLAGAVEVAAITCERRGADPPTRAELPSGWPAG